MKQWSRGIEINAPIEQVWQLLNGTLEDTQKIMPNVIANEPVTLTDNMVGSIHRQKYQEGKRIMEYDVETLEYTNQPDLKSLKVGFTINKMFEITAAYELKKIDETKTDFTYMTSNKPLKWFLKPFLLFAGDKVVVEFVDRVKRVAENSN